MMKLGDTCRRIHGIQSQSMLAVLLKYRLLVFVCISNKSSFVMNNYYDTISKVIIIFVTAILKKRQNDRDMQTIVTHGSALHVGMAAKKNGSSNQCISSYTAITRP